MRYRRAGLAQRMPVLLPTYRNVRLTFVPRENKSKYRPLAAHQDLGEILCIEQWRKIKCDHMVSLDAATYQLYPEDLGSIPEKKASRIFSRMATSSATMAIEELAANARKT